MKLTKWIPGVRRRQANTERGGSKGPSEAAASTVAALAPASGVAAAPGTAAPATGGAPEGWVPFQEASLYADPSETPGVNLIPSSYRAGARTVKDLTWALIVALVLVAAAVAVRLFLSVQSASLQPALQATPAWSEDLAVATNKLHRLDARLKALQSEQSATASWAAPGPKESLLSITQELQRLLPDGVWVRSLEISDGQVRLEGSALGWQALGLTMNRLQLSGFWQDARLESCVPSAADTASQPDSQSPAGGAAGAGSARRHLASEQVVDFVLVRGGQHP